MSLYFVEVRKIYKFHDVYLLTLVNFFVCKVIRFTTKKHNTDCDSYLVYLFTSVIKWLIRTYPFVIIFGT